MNQTEPILLRLRSGTACFDPWLWAIRFAGVNPFLSDLERVIFSLFSRRKRLVYFQTLRNDGSFPTDPKLRPISVRVKITPARDYNRMRSVFMLHFRVPSRCKFFDAFKLPRYILGLLTAGKGSVAKAGCAAESNEIQGRSLLRLVGNCSPGFN
jgi:hypothetical protein